LKGNYILELEAALEGYDQVSKMSITLNINIFDSCDNVKITPVILESP
jgi:hypothetical protein